MIGWIAVGGATVAIAAWAAGARLPAEVRVGRALRAPLPPEAVWHVITDWHGQPSWRRELKGLDDLRVPGALTAWRERHHGGPSVAYALVESEPPRRLLLRIGEPDAPEAARREVRLEPAEGGATRVIILEQVLAPGAFERLRLRWDGPDRFVDKYARALAKRLGASGEVEALTP